MKLFELVLGNLNNTFLSERVLIKENDIQTHVPFLHLYINIIDNKFAISIYDKHDDFSFAIFIFIISYISKLIAK